MNTFDLSLDLDKRAGVTQWVTMRQGDHDGTQLRATIYDHGTQVSGSYTCRVSIRKPTDNEYYRETCSFSGGIAIVTIDEQYAASEVGITYGYFELLQGTAVIASTENFGVRILQSAIDGAIVAPPYDSAIEDALAELDEATGRISQMVVDATAEYLEAHPELTTTVEDNSLTDAKLIQKGGILQREQWLETMLPNIPRKTTAEADVHSVTDSAGGGPLGITVYGRSTQDGTPTPDAPVPIQSVTPNLFGTPVQASITGNGPYSVNLGANGTVFFCEVKPSTTYTVVSFEGNKFRLFTSEVDPSGGGSVEMVSRVNVDNPAVGYSLSFTTSPTERYVALTANTTSGGYDSDLKVAMFEGRGRYPFVPYGNIGLGADSGNILPNDKFNGVVQKTITSNGVTLTRNDDGSVTLSGTSTAVCYFNIGGQFHVKAGETYALSGCPTNSVSLLLYNDYKGLTDSGSGAVNTFTEDSWFNIFIRVPNGANVNGLTFHPQLERGGTIHPYRPYVNPVTIPIDLQGHALRSLPDGTRDEVTVDEWGHAVLTQRVGHAIFDGSSDEMWSSTSNSESWAIIAANIGAVAQSGLNLRCDRLTPNVSPLANMPVWTTKITDAWYVKTDGITTMAEWREWLASNPLTLDYQLATPQTIDLGHLDPALLPAPDLTAYVVPSAPSVLRYGFDVAQALAEIATA